MPWLRLQHGSPEFDFVPHMWHTNRVGQVRVNSESVLRQAAAGLRKKLAARRDLRHGQADLKTVHAFVRLLDEYIRELEQKIGWDHKQAALVRSKVLQSSFPALLSYRRGDLDEALQWISDTWKTYALAAGAMVGPQEAVEQQTELLRTFDLAVSDVLAEGSRESQARLILRRLMVHLDLSQDELGRMLRVSGETVRRWERGHNEVPAVRVAELVSADAALARLLDLFRPESLPQAIRRRAELFGGESALDWILRGRMAEVADRYEAALVYQA